MKILQVLLLGLAMPLVMTAQGFDWQYSVRQPVNPPTTFYGAEATYGRSLHGGGFQYLERVPCCSFEDGQGSNYSLSVMLESWERGDLAVWGGLGYRNVAGLFASDVQRFPLSDGRTVQTQYEYSTSLSYIVLQGGVRFRPFASNVNIGAGLRLSTLLGASGSIEEVVLSPEDYFFTTNPPSRRHQMGSVNTVASISAFNAAFLLSGGYDIAIARGMYLSPQIVFGIPLTNTASDVQWRTADVSVSIRYLRAF